VTLARSHLLDQAAQLHVSLVRMITAQFVVQLPPLDNVAHVVMVITRTAIVSV